MPRGRLSEAPGGPSAGGARRRAAGGGSERAHRGRRPAEGARGHPRNLSGKPNPKTHPIFLLSETICKKIGWVFGLVFGLGFRISFRICFWVLILRPPGASFWMKLGAPTGTVFGRLPGRAPGRFLDASRGAARGEGSDASRASTVGGRGLSRAFWPARGRPHGGPFVVVWGPPLQILLLPPSSFSSLVVIFALRPFAPRALPPCPRPSCRRPPWSASILLVPFPRRPAPNAQGH